MDQDTLRFLLREAVRETVTEVLQTVLELDRTAFLQAHGGRRNGYYPRRLETTFGQVDQSSRDFCGFLFRGPKRAHVQVTPESPVLTVFP
jgi:hypothetical protein